ncbi:6-phosphogluconolactonase [Candidatus Gillettellia adelgis]
MQQIVYVASPDSQQIHVWKLHDTGVLVLLQTINVPGQVQPMSISPNKRYLYVGVRPVCNIINYRIRGDGTLYQASIAPLTGSPSYISTDLLGRYLFSASYSDHCISVNKIRYDGLVTKPIQKITSLMTPHSVNVDLTNQLLLVPCLKEDCIRLFNLSLDGYLTPHTLQFISTASGSGPRHMAFYPTGHYAYCVNELDGTVDVFMLSNNQGKLCLIQTLDIMPEGFTNTRWASDIHIMPNGRFLYTSERTASILTIFKISDSGSRLSVVGYHATEEQPRGFNIDHSGHFLISSGQKTDYITIYKINQSNGTLSTLARYPVGKKPMWISVLTL